MNKVPKFTLMFDGLDEVAVVDVLDNPWRYDGLSVTILEDGLEGKLVWIYWWPGGDVWIDSTGIDGTWYLILKDGYIGYTTTGMERRARELA